MSEESLDQFFTKRSVAKKLVEKVNEFKELCKFDIIIEPSAGDGSFSDILPADTTTALDIEPRGKNIHKKNFLNFYMVLYRHISKYKPLSVLTIGNPPFGKNASLAKKFFNYSAFYSDVIAFILPRTFRKPSIINYLNKNFHLIHEEMLDTDSFYTPLEDSYEVPTVFQVWEKREQARQPIPVSLTCEDFEFVGKDEGDFSIRRVGVKAGTVFDDCERNYRSHYFIKVKNNTIDVKDILSSITWEKDGPKYDTAGNPSISKNDLINFYKTNKTVSAF